MDTIEGLSNLRGMLVEDSNAAYEEKRYQLYSRINKHIANVDSRLHTLICTLPHVTVAR